MIGTTFPLRGAFALAVLLAIRGPVCASSAHADPSAHTVRVIVRLDVAEVPASMRETEAGKAMREEALVVALGELERALSGTTWTVVRRFEAISFVALEVSPSALDRLGSAAVVLSIQEDRFRRPKRLERPLLVDSGPLVQADDAWRLGYDGSGWTIAVIDDGVASSHPFLVDKVVSEACFTSAGNCPNGQNSQIGPGAGRPCDYAPADDCAHGTHVAGIAAGVGGTFSGVERGSGIARGASVIAIMTQSHFSDDECRRLGGDPPCIGHRDSDVLAALEHVYELRDSYRIAAVNMSLGGDEEFVSEEECDLEKPAEKAMIDRLRSVGIATVISAGNEEFVHGLVESACVSSAISVGATTKNDEVAWFSNSADYLDLLAPGDGYLGGGIDSSVPPDGFEGNPGTSQACPHVAGAFAILSQVLGESDVDLVLQTLKETGLPVLDPRNGLTKPRIRIRAAIESLTSGRPSGVQITPDGEHTLVSKDVGSERWALTQDLDDGTVTGNVFTDGDRTPQFVWCEQIGSDGGSNPDDVQLTFECFGAGTCLDDPCRPHEWHKISEVTLPGAFFRPGAALPAGSTSSASRAANAETVEQAQPSPPSGRQITPDAEQVLVNKDVGAERWAITRNEDDGTVVGNVYRESGGEPAFLWCRPTGDKGSVDVATREVTYSCSAAARCTSAPCTPDQWTFLAEATLPESFFTR